MSKFVVHVVSAGELEPYLNGGSFSRRIHHLVDDGPAPMPFQDERRRRWAHCALVFSSKPHGARLVGLFQEERANSMDPGHNYRVVWEVSP